LIRKWKRGRRNEIYHQEVGGKAVKIKIDKDGITLTSEDSVDFAYLDLWTQGKEVYLPSFGIHNSRYNKEQSIAVLRIGFREHETEPEKKL
jgi:hypothetical protein